MRTALGHVDLSEPSLPLALLKMFISHPGDIKEFVTPHTPRTDSKEATESLIIHFINDYHKFHTQEENIQLINLCYKHNLISKKTHSMGLKIFSATLIKESRYQAILENIEAHKQFKN